MHLLRAAVAFCFHLVGALVVVVVALILAIALL